MTAFMAAAPAAAPTWQTTLAAARAPGLTARAGAAAAAPLGAESTSTAGAARFGLVAGLAIGAAGAARRNSRRAARKSKVVANVGAVVTPEAEAMVQIVEPPDNLREWRIQSGEKMLASGGKWPAPKNDRMLSAARGEPVDRPPKWMMRQAGRYLPEYQAVLANSDFFTVCGTPALACEVTLQPYRRYPSLDSLIIFSDILVIPVAMGMPCHMEANKGPQFSFALKTPEDLDKLNLTPDVPDTLGYVFDAIFWTRQRVNNEVPVIGFCGAPWTLMGYMVEGGAVSKFDNAKKWLYLYPEASRKLLKALREIIVEYLVGQYDAGAPLLTVFDTNCGEIPPSVYEDFMIEDLKYIAVEVKKRRPNAMMTVFPKDGECATWNDSEYDVIAASWTSSPAQMRKDCPDKTLQGNLDPFLLYADEAQIKERTRRMVKEFGVDRYIANLGHGMLPTHPLEGPAAFIAGVDSCTHESLAKEGHSAPAPAPAAAAAPPPPAGNGPKLVLHLKDETAVSIPFSESGALAMKAALNGFIATFKEKMAAKAKRYDNFEHTWSKDGLSVELFCNLNAFATIFDVSMFVTVRLGDGIKVTSEMPLSALQSDVDAFLS